MTFYSVYAKLQVADPPGFSPSAKDVAYFGGYFYLTPLLEAAASMTSTALGPAFDGQADRLLASGLQSDRTALIQRLQAVGENRLADYAEYFREGARYRAGTTLEMVWRLYEFDRRLRSLCFEAIEGIEVHTRTQLAYCFAYKHSDLAYLDGNNFPSFARDKGDFSRWQQNISEQISRARDLGVLHDVQTMPPIQALVECMDFGTMLLFFRGVGPEMRKSIADTAEQPDAVVLSWLWGLRRLRNFCAHHHRIWNWRFRKNRVKTPQSRKFPEWHSPRIPNDQMGIYLTICRYWLNRIHLGNDWTERVFALCDAYPEAPASALGFPENWRRHPLWTS